MRRIVVFLSNLIFFVSCTKQETEIYWAIPSSFPYGQKLTNLELNAKANVPGHFIYNPPLGTRIYEKNNKITVRFIPTNLEKYDSIQKTISLNLIPLHEFLTKKRWIYQGININYYNEYPYDCDSGLIYKLNDLSSVQLKREYGRCNANPMDTMIENYWSIINDSTILFKYFHKLESINEREMRFGPYYNLKNYSMVFIREQN